MAGATATRSGRAVRGASAAVLGLAVLASAALAQGAEPSGGAGAPAPQGAGAEAAQQAHAWDGTTSLPGGVTLGEAPDLGGAKAERLRAALGEALVTLRVERDLAAVAAALDGLWLHAAARQAFEGQAEVLVELALARSELHELRGEPELALRATERLLLDGRDPRWSAVAAALVPAPPELLRLAERAAQDPRLVARREELAAALAGRGGQQGLEELAELAVREDGIDADFLRQIGAPAAPALARAVLDTVGQLPPPEDDPLRLLIELDPRVAGRAMLESFEAGGPLWWKRIAVAMARGRVLEDPEAWIPLQEGGYPPRWSCAVPEWLDVLALLVRRHGLDPDVQGMVRHVLQLDALTPALEGALLARLREASPDETGVFVRLLDFTLTELGRRRSLVVAGAPPILEAALETDDPILRRFAAVRLLDFRTRALLGLADDADPVLREACARSLLRRQLETLVVDRAPASDQLSATPTRPAEPVWTHRRLETSFTPSFGPPEREALARLLGDPEASVRTLAVQALERDEAPQDPDLYERLLDDPAPEVRRALARIARSLPPEVRRETLLRLAGDPSPLVHGALDFDAAPLAEDPGSWLPALRVRLAAVPPGEWEDVLDLGSFLPTLLRTGEGLHALVGWASAWPEDELLLRVFDAMSRGGFERDQRLALLGDEELAALYVRTSRAAPDKLYFLDRVVEQSSPPRAAAMRLVLSDPGAERWVRLHAARHAAPAGGVELGEALVALLHELAGDPRPLSAKEASTLAHIGGDLPRGERNALLLRVLRDPGIPAGLALPLLSAYLPEQEVGREITLELLARWLDVDGPLLAPVQTALRHVRSLPEDADSQLLIRALSHPGYARVVVETMGTLRRPEFVEPLGRAMEAEWILADGERFQVQLDAVQALASYLDESAVPPLLRGLGSSHPGVRGTCSSALEQLRAYRDQQASWAEVGERPATREDAVARLAAMLDEPDPLVRAQAARGLGTLRAVELLPRLIELLGDADAAVRAAAQEALDRLNG